jgi:putative transposase
MTLNQSALLELTDVLRTADGGKVMRLMLSAMLQALVDAEATAAIGATPYEHTPSRTTQRNGTREKTVSTAAGDLMVKIPKLRAGSFFPSLLAPRRRIDVALYAVVMEAYVHGVSTRKVDDLVAALGVDTGISKSEVSRICADLDADVAVFQGRELTEQAFPYVFVDATYCKARVAGRVVSQAVVIATGVSADGRREVLGSAVGDSETQDFWTEFLRGLRERGLHGVQLVISDHHRGLMNAIDAVMVGAFCAELARSHSDTNVLCIGGKIIGSAIALEIVRVWMATEWLGESEGGEKYARRSPTSAPTQTTPQTSPTTSTQQPSRPVADAVNEDPAVDFTPRDRAR